MHSVPAGRRDVGSTANTGRGGRGPAAFGSARMRPACAPRAAATGKADGRARTSTPRSTAGQESFHEPHRLAGRRRRHRPLPPRLPRSALRRTGASLRAGPRRPSLLEPRTHHDRQLRRTRQFRHVGQHRRFGPRAATDGRRHAAGQQRLRQGRRGPRRVACTRSTARPTTVDAVSGPAPGRPARVNGPPPPWPAAWRGCRRRAAHAAGRRRATARGSRAR